MHLIPLIQDRLRTTGVVRRRRAKKATYTLLALQRCSMVVSFQQLLDHFKLPLVVFMT